MQIEQKILKAVLLLRNFNRYSSKEEQIEEQLKWYREGYTTEKDIDNWITDLKAEIKKTPEEREAESLEMIKHLEECENNNSYYDDYYTPSATHGDYSPSCPWNAPGMSISDFI